jgi:polar amino acid transport system substrate-binding protein
MPARSDHPARRTNPLTAFLLLLGALLAAIVSACGGDDAAPGTPDDNPGDTATFVPTTPGALTVVTSLPAPGFFDGPATGSDREPSAIEGGYEYDIANTLRQKLGLEHLVLREEPFDAIVAGKVSGYDIALSQISITDERRQVVDFTKPYFESSQSVLMRTGSAATVPETAADARGLRWGVADGSTAETLLDTVVHPDTAPQVFDDLDDAYEALGADVVDAVLVDTAINLGEAARSKGRFVVVAQFEQAGGPDQYGGVVPKGSPNLPIFDALITDLHKTGELKRLARDDLTKDPEDLPVIRL